MGIKNVDMSIDGDILTIKVNLAEEHGLSKSGKNIVIATTAGNADVLDRDGVKIGLNIFRKPD